MQKVSDILRAYDPGSSLESASTIPSAWYTDQRIADLTAATD